MSDLALLDIHRRFPSSGGVVRALDGVDLTVPAGSVVGLVGESGCGKTTLTRIAVGLDRPDKGEVRFDGRPLVGPDGTIALDTRRRIQLVFQDSYASFNPRRTIGGSIAMAMRRHRRLGRFSRNRVTVIGAVLERCGLEADLQGRYPHMLSGGQLQRASIARALSLDPEILVCDEPVASMDVSVRAQILNLLLDLRQERGIGILFVSHDLGVVRRIAEQVAVMYLGRIVEVGASEAIWASPRHPYSRALADSMPTGDARWRQGTGRPRLEGEPPSAVAIPGGCRFHPRCPIAIDRCRVDDPLLRPFPDGVSAACHLAR